MSFGDRNEVTAPIGSIASGTAPASPSVGTSWYDTGANKLKVWDGAAWNTVVAGDNFVTAGTPANPNGVV